MIIYIQSKTFMQTAMQTWINGGTFKIRTYLYWCTGKRCNGISVQGDWANKRWRKGINATTISLSLSLSSPYGLSDTKLSSHCEQRYSRIKWIYHNRDIFILIGQRATDLPNSKQVRNIGGNTFKDTSKDVIFLDSAWYWFHIKSELYNKNSNTTAAKTSVLS